MKSDGSLPHSLGERVPHGAVGLLDGWDMRKWRKKKKDK